MKDEKYIDAFYKEGGMYRRDFGEPYHIVIDTIEDGSVIWYITACGIQLTSQYHIMGSKITCDSCNEG